MEKWAVADRHQRMLDELFDSIGEEGLRSILDAGSGRTSIAYLAGRFKEAYITGIVYPGDRRKIDSIRQSVEARNYEIIETDLKDFVPEGEYDAVLAHLLLGESRKFGGNTFEGVLASLMALPARYMLIVDIETDQGVDYGMLHERMAQWGELVHTAHVTDAETGTRYIGFALARR
jgi:hypothetical protein